jgi:hypothetical protein
MSERIGKPALAPPPTRSAGPWRDDPSEFLAAHFEYVWQTRKRDLPSVNPALTVDVIGFSRQQGDWLGVVVTPWFINLFMFSGTAGTARGRYKSSRASAARCFPTRVFACLDGAALSLNVRAKPAPEMCCGRWEK